MNLQLTYSKKLNICLNLFLNVPTHLAKVKTEIVKRLSNIMIHIYFKSFTKFFLTHLQRPWSHRR